MSVTNRMRLRWCVWGQDQMWLKQNKDRAPNSGAVSLGEPKGQIVYFGWNISALQRAMQSPRVTGGRNFCFNVLISLLVKQTKRGLRLMECYFGEAEERAPIGLGTSGYPVIQCMQCHLGPAVPVPDSCWLSVDHQVYFTQSNEQPGSQQNLPHNSHQTCQQ